MTLRYFEFTHQIKDLTYNFTSIENITEDLKNELKLAVEF